MVAPLFPQESAGGGRGAWGSDTARGIPLEAVRVVAHQRRCEKGACTAARGLPLAGLPRTLKASFGGLQPRAVGAR